jgi:hypothetical protein
MPSQDKNSRCQKVECSRFIPLLRARVVLTTTLFSKYFFIFDMRCDKQFHRILSDVSTNFLTYVAVLYLPVLYYDDLDE